MHDQQPSRRVAAAAAALVLMGGAVSCATPSTPGIGHVASPAAAPTDTPTESPSAYQPTKGDFTLKVKILSQECFGEAGCNITFRIKPEYTGPPLDPDVTYEVTYEVSGTQDPMSNTFTITGDQASVEQEELAQTTSASIELRAHVTDVEQVS